MILFVFSARHAFNFILNSIIIINHSGAVVSLVYVSFFARNALASGDPDPWWEDGRVTRREIANPTTIAKECIINHPVESRVTEILTFGRATRIFLIDQNLLTLEKVPALFGKKFLWYLFLKKYASHQCDLPGQTYESAGIFHSPFKKCFLRMRECSGKIVACTLMLLATTCIFIPHAHSWEHS